MLANKFYDFIIFSRENINEMTSIYYDNNKKNKYKLMSTFDHVFSFIKLETLIKNYNDYVEKIVTLAEEHEKFEEKFSREILFSKNDLLDEKAIQTRNIIANILSATNISNELSWISGLGLQVYKINTHKLNLNAKIKESKIFWYWI